MCSLLSRLIFFRMFFLYSHISTTAGFIALWRSYNASPLLYCSVLNTFGTFVIFPGIETNCMSVTDEVYVVETRAQLFKANDIVS